jgi:hypothetical protein
MKKQSPPRCAPVDQSRGVRLAETKKCTDTGAPVSAKFPEKSGAA